MSWRAVLAALVFPTVFTTEVADDPNNGIDWNCPCPYGQAPSKACVECRNIRCEIGGSAFTKWVKTESWAKSIGEHWSKTCQSLTMAGPHTSTTVVCNTVASPCGIVCVGQPVNCTHVCTQNLKHASHACSSFPWPVPFSKTGLADTHLPDVFT
eukprot:TRINITY_DN3070_c0_g2_i2.p1 TRINITY_DN3070_c0_g2~~TRINITY_DN3070_c0_g2_i2.p1  ORF type:complete len:154 (-),score=12.26 TRINITY_DN3070_c0_g2_i2:63-524(-)